MEDGEAIKIALRSRMAMGDLMKVTVAGAGYVGLSNAVLLARDNEVTIVDVNQARVDLVMAGRSPIKDEDIEAAFHEGGLSLKATSDPKEGYGNASFVVVATPTDFDPVKKGLDASSVESVIGLVKEINPSAWCIIRSTLPIGFTRKLQEKLGFDHLLFIPEFLREGKAMKDTLSPSRLVIGTLKEDEETKKAAEEAAFLLLSPLKGKKVDIAFVKAEEAEAIKLFSNAYLAMRVAFFDELDGFALKHGLSSKAIIHGVSLDPRIGDYYNNPSFGYGGYCLSKDTKELGRTLVKDGALLIPTVDLSNEMRKEKILVRLLAYAAENPEKTIGFYRLSSKAGSDGLRSSSTLDLLRGINAKGVKAIIFEPSLEGESFEGNVLEKDLTTFKEKADLIVANRVSSHLSDVKDKIFSRDVYHRD